MREWRVVFAGVLATGLWAQGALAENRAALGRRYVGHAWNDTEILCTPANRAAARASSFGCYRGYSASQYDSFERSSIYVKARDGTRLAVDVYRPVIDGKPVKARLPVVFTYSRYWRAERNPDGSTMTYAGLMPAGARTARIADSIEAAPRKARIVAQLLSRGYIFVRAEARGTGASFGIRDGDMSSIEAQDGYDMIAWAAVQPWSNGKVGMIGGSYEGMSQLLVASTKPPALRAIFPMVAPFDEYHSSWSGAGVLRSFGLAWLAREARRDGVQQGRAGSVINPSVADGPVVPPVDEDINGTLRDAARHERLSDAEAVDPTSYFTRQSPAAKAMIDLVGDALKDRSPAAVLEVLYSPDALEALVHKTPGLREKLNALHFYRDASPMLRAPQSLGPNNLATLAPAISRSQVGVYNWGGWRDFATIDTLLWDANLTNPRKLAMGPWSHGPNEPDDMREAASFVISPIEQLRWLDYWLKGIDNGIMLEPRVAYAIMEEGDGFEWAYARGWPAIHTAATRYQFGQRGELVKQAPTGSLSFTVDPRTTLGDHTRYHDAIGLGPTRYPDLAEHARRGLSFTSAPLTRDLIVAGIPAVNLSIRSTTPDAWPHAYLQRIERDGSIAQLSDGVIRASHRLLGRAPYQALSSNFSDSRKAAVDATEPLSATHSATVSFDLQPIVANFPKGSRLRVVITGAEAGTDMTLPQDPVTRLTLDLGGARGSAIVLPVARRP